MYSVEVTAKKAEDALKDALKQLSATIDDVDVKVLEAGGLFRSAKLVVTLTPDVRERRERRNRKEKGRENSREETATQPFKENKARFERNAESKNCVASGRKPDVRSNERQFSSKEQPRLTAQSDVNADSFVKQREQQKDKTRPENVRLQQNEQRGSKESKSSNVTDVKSEVPEKTLEATKIFLKNVMEKMGFSGEMTVKTHGLDIDITVLEEDSAIIGYRGETIDSLEYLAGLIANRDSEKYIKVSVDNNNYRDKRSDNLVKLAEKMAAKCIKSGHKVSLEPMNSANRKVVHAALSSNEKVTTRSEGKEPNRRVVIYCKRERGGKGGDEKGRAPSSAPETNAEAKQSDSVVEEII
ncbi:MAG: KH domain-containing protein [Clostridia bacterium]|nr:KH domain-containing protein [Clostridia bacterium]